MNRRRILILMPGHLSGPCGIVDHALLVAQAAHHAGWDVTLFPVNPINPEFLLGAVTTMGLSAFRLVASGANAPAHTAEALATELAQHRPDLVSVQFPLFPNRISHILSGAHLRCAHRLRNHRTVVTIHETWIQPEEWARVPVARTLVRRIELILLLRWMRPARALVSNPLHQAQISPHVSDTKLVRIFSTIPIDHAPDAVALGQALLAKAAQSGAGSAMNHEAAFRVVVLGRIPPDWLDLEAMISAIGSHAQSMGRHAHFISIGKTAYRGAGWERLRRAVAAPHVATRLGLLPMNEVSRVMQTADLALCPTPSHLWTKSSACAAYALHGIPVLFTSAPSSEPQPPHYADIAKGRLQFFEGHAEPDATPALTFERMTT